MPRTILAGVAAIAALGGCASIADLPEERVGQAALRLANGIPVGTLQLLKRGDVVSYAVVLTGLEPGSHGFHLHTAGKCVGPDFTSAGGHLNPGGNSHGSMSDGGQHLGDLPNLEVGENRSASSRGDLMGPASDVLASIFDEDGTAVVVHAKPDDYRTDPSGDAGSRIACGVIEAS